MLPFKITNEASAIVTEAVIIHLAAVRIGAGANKFVKGDNGLEKETVLY